MQRRRRGVSQQPLEALRESDIPAFAPDKNVDMGTQERAFDKFQTGVPPTESLVFTNFDARPIAGGDFVSNGFATLLPSDVVPNVGGGFYNFTVPDGYRAILRSFQYECFPLFDVSIITDVTTRITIGGPAFDLTDGTGQPGSGGSNQRGFDQMVFGQIMSEPFPTYLLAEGGQTISLLFVFSGNYLDLSVDGVNTIAVTLYGNLLTSSGRAITFEPGTNPEQLVSIQARAKGEK